MSIVRSRRQWPGWIDELLREYGPFAELEPEWKAALGDAITRVLDSRAGLLELPRCENCGKLKTLACTIIGCGLPRPYRFRLSTWIARRLP